MRRPWTSDDLNYLLYRQQVEHSRARAAASGATREAHCGLAHLYEEAIEQLTGADFRLAAAPDASAK
jgi:hypothetical protein